MLNVLLLGPQGAGKGTHAKRIAADYELPHISTGEMFRAAIAAQSELGRRVEPILAAGHDGFRLETERSAVAHGGAQHVARGDVSQPALGRNPPRLGALAGTRGSHQDQVERHAAT